MEGERGRFVPRHQGHRRILLAFIIVIAMSTSAVQYYHLRRCLLRHCPSLHSPRSSSLYLTHTTTPRVDSSTNPVFPSSFGFALVLSSSLMSRLKFRLYFLLNLLFPNFYFIVIYIHVYYYSFAPKLRKF